VRNPILNCNIAYATKTNYEGMGEFSTLLGFSALSILLSYASITRNAQGYWGIYPGMGVGDRTDRE